MPPRGQALVNPGDAPRKNQPSEDARPDFVPTARAIALQQGTTVARRPGGGPPTLAKRAMRNNADEGSSLPISMPEGFRNPDAEGPTKKQRMSAWVDSTLLETAVATVAGIAR